MTDENGRVWRRILYQGKLAWLIFFAFFLHASAGRSAVPDDIPADFPRVQLPGKVRGQAAIAALGNQLPAIAAYYRTTEAELRGRLLRDRDLWVNEYGRLFYVCTWPVPLLPPAEEERPTPTPLAVSPAGYPYEQTFLLHSRPGSSKLIYLDFNGHDASTTSWGADAIGRPFDIDSDPTTFSNTERDRIQYIWLRVAEDFALYDIDVTTEDPGVEALRRSPTTDPNYGIRVVIGGSSSDWYGSAGGVAFIGSFDSTSDVPTWVWPGSLSNTEKNIAEATSHEVGHTLGLGHDGADVGTNHTEYYGGHGNWAPIMGVGYSRPITQWSRGEYTNANNPQDDLTVMLNDGAAYRPDDHGNSIGAETALSGVFFSVPGNIERATDVDFFSFAAGAGRVVITATPAPRGPNLRSQLSLYDSFGALITSTNVADNSSGTLPVSLTATLPIGTYYVSIEGIGSLSPVNTGYSDYASIGQYRLSGSLPSDGGWIATEPGTAYSWIDPLNWSSNTVPIGAGATARVANNILGDQTISLDMPVTVGRLILGDADSLHAFTLEDGTGGSLHFNATTNQAFLIKTSGGHDLIAATITLQTNLWVTNTTANTLTLSGNNGGTGSLLKFGSGPLLLGGNNSYAGSTIVAAGTLLLQATASLASPTIEVQPNALLDVTALAGFILGFGQTLSGGGGIVGDVNAGFGSQLSPGGNGVANTLTFSNQLSLQDGSKLSFDLAGATVPGSGTNDLLVIAGNLALAGTVLVDFNFLDSFPASPATYTLLTYSGALSGGASNFVAVSATNRYAFVFDDSLPGQVLVHVSGQPTNLVWQGDGVLNSWEVAGAANWLDGAGPAQFFQLDHVTLDDGGSNSPAINLIGAIRPSSLTVNGTKNYTLAGAGKLSGMASLLKQGTGTLTLSTANDHAGSATVAAGILRIGHGAALGQAVGPTIIGAGAALDLSALSLGAEPVIAEGAGTGSGAVFSSTPTIQSNALRFVTLSGDATFGGSGRWDIRANPSGSFIGNNFNLTKTNANEIWLVELGATGLGDINVDQGLLALQGSTTLGDAARALNLAANATLLLAGTDNNVISKRLVMNGSSLQSASGNNIFAGPIALNGANVIAASNIFTLQGQISGGGSLRKAGIGILSVTASNTFSGATTISAGTLQTRNSWALGSTNGPTIITNGGRLDLGGMNLGAEAIIAQGTGLGNAGAIVNNGAAQTNALRFVTLSGNTSFGGIGRWDIRANPTGSLLGNNFNLTKTGINEIWLVNLGNSGLITITVSEGLLGFQGSTTMGNSAASLTVSSAGTLALFGNGTNILSKVVTLNTARFYNANGSNLFIGPITLNNSNRIETASSSTLHVSGTIGGSGTLHSIGSGTLILSANNSYSGPTRVASGTLQFGNGGLSGAPGGGNITNNGILVFHRTNSFTLANFITGTGTLRHGVVNAANPFVGSVLTLSGNNNYSGQTIINGHGNLISVATDLALGTGILVFNGNANGNSVSGIRSANLNSRTLANTLQFGGGNLVQFGVPGSGDLIFNGPLVITDNADKTLIVSNAVTTIANVIGNNSRIIKSGPGTLVLSGNNTNGGCIINLGTLRVNAETRLGRNLTVFTPNQLTLNGGTLQTTASFAIDDSNRGLTVGAGGGNFNVDAGTTLTIANVITGPGNWIKSGPGTLRLNAVNTGSGAVTNLNGALVIEGTLPGSSVEIAGGELSGGGIINAPVLIQPAGTISPGTGSIGTLTISNDLTLGGVTSMQLNHATLESDLVQGLAQVTYGGTLTLANLAGTLAHGDTFKLFDATSYTGSFTNIVPPTPGPMLAWDLSRLTLDGTLAVIALQPQFAPPVITGSDILFSGSGGTPGGTFYVLSSTNVAAPTNEWVVFLTNSFDGNGNFNFLAPLDPNAPQKFYRIQLP